MNLLPRRAFLQLAGAGILGTALSRRAPGADAAAARPNILWITCEDMGPQLGCYGDTYATTPNLDALAGHGMRYRFAWSNAPVCAPARTTIISGVYPTSTGSEHMRSEVRMPPSMRMYPQLLREAGYYCTNNSKEDYNLAKPGAVWDDSSGKAHWRNRPAGKPFFAIFNNTMTHESQIRTRPHEWKHDPAKVRLPAYHPDTIEVRQDWAQYYDNITRMDATAGTLLADLKADGLADDTIVFFYGDHGSGMPRSKRFPCNSGLRVPLIVHFPAKFRHLAPKDYKPGAVSDRLAAFVDLAPTLLSLAGAKAPGWMEGGALMGPHEAPPASFTFGFRGRMDTRHDTRRSCSDGRYVYVRNFAPHLPAGQFIAYMFQTPTTRVWKQLYDEGKLKPPQTFFWEPKPPEELYDLDNDPDEVRNLAGDAEHKATLEKLRAALRAHLLRTRDVGLLPEAEFHRRAGDTSIYEMARDPKRYPVEKILEAAERAASMKADDLPSLKDGLKDADPGVRYWSAMGFRMRGADAVQGARAELLAALSDDNPSVKTAAADALANGGGEDDLAKALAVLKELASPEKNGCYVAIGALNVIALLGPKAAPIHDYLRTMPRKDPTQPGRPNEYAGRLLDEMLGAGEQPAAAKEARRERAAKRQKAK